MNVSSLADHKTPFIRIDTTLKPSVYKKLVWGLSLLVFVLMVILLPLAMAKKILVVLAAIVALWFEQIYCCHLLAIASLDAKHNREKSSDSHDQFDFLAWQLQWVRGRVKVPWGSKQDVWQATLIDIADMGCMLILTFNLIEPLPNTMSVRIWQDQVDRETWRQFKVLAR